MRQHKAEHRVTHNIRNERYNLTSELANIRKNMTSSPESQAHKIPRVQLTVSKHGLVGAVFTSDLNGGSELAPRLTPTPSKARPRLAHQLITNWSPTKASGVLTPIKQISSKAAQQISLLSLHSNDDMNNGISRSSRPVATVAAASTERIQVATGGSTKPTPGPVASKPTSTLQNNRSTKSRITDGEISTTLPLMKAQSVSGVSSAITSAEVPDPKSGLAPTQKSSTNVRAQLQSSSPLPSSPISTHGITLTGIQGSQISKLDTGVLKSSDSKQTQLTTEMPALASSSDTSMVKDDQPSQTHDRHAPVPNPQEITPTREKQTSSAATTARSSAPTHASPQAPLSAAILSGVSQIGGTIIPPGEPKSKAGIGKHASITASNLRS